MAVDGPVVLSPEAAANDAARFYAAAGGTHLANVRFADNVQVSSATRAYRRCLDEWFPQRLGTVVDLGCGDGRITRWAMEKGAITVVALDFIKANLDAVRSTASAVGFPGELLLVGAGVVDGFLRPAAFDTVLCFEVLSYLCGAKDRVDVLRSLRTLLKPGGTLVLSEFPRHGRVLADVVAMNVDNMRRTAFQGKRLEKSAATSVEVTHPTLEELRQDCAAAGFTVVEARGVSPISMLFQHAYNFTSYPLRPPLDAEMQRIIERLEDGSCEPCELSRNVVLRLQDSGQCL